MKKILCLALSLAFLAAAVTAFAASEIQKTQLLTNKATSGSSTVLDTGLLTRKSVVFSGSSSSANVASPISGTAIVECGVSTTGPYVTARDIGGAAASTTTNTIFDIDSMCRYVRVTWTRTSQKLNAWVFYGK